jgi:hypothetical protein
MNMDKDFEIKKKELLKSFLLETGAALMDCQCFEYGIALLLHHFSRLGVIGLDVKQTTAILENEAKKTAGQLINMLQKHIKVSEELENKLVEALNARNSIIHRVIIDNVEKLPNPESRKALVKEINLLRSRVRLADTAIRTIVNELGSAIDGFNVESFEKEIKSKFY